MPYISADNIKEISMGRAAETPGELNYMLTQQVLRYLYHHGLQYVTLSDIMGAFEGAKLEFYRRVVAPYEDRKIKENGDVYPTGQQPDHPRSRDR